MGQDEAFGEFVEERWGRLVRTAVLLGCRVADAEDIVQTALIRCLVHWPRVVRADDPDAYVHRILLNTLASARRRRWSGEQPTAELPEGARTHRMGALGTIGGSDVMGSTDGTDAVDRADAVRRLLALLNPDQRAVVVLRFYADLTEAQAASALSVPLGTVKSRLSRALRVMAEASGAGPQRPYGAAGEQPIELRGRT